MADDINKEPPSDTKDKKPTVYFHEDSKLHYLRGKDNVLFENGVAVARKVFDDLKDIPGKMDTILSVEFDAKGKNTNYDWAFACSTGFLRRKKSIAPTEHRQKKQEAEIPQMPPQEDQKKEAPRQEFIFSSAFLIMIVMTAVGIGSAIMSAYHTSAFLVYGGKPIWTAVLTGIMLILFSTTAFTAARHFFHEKGGLHYFFSALFVIAGFAVISYSMFSTLTVNFEQFQWRSNEKSQVIVSESENLAAHRKLVQQNKDALDDIAAEITSLENDAKYWQTMSWKRYDEIQAALTDARNRRNTLREDSIKLTGKTPELIEVEAVSQDTVYRFVARMFKVDEDAMRFFVYVIPACLYDILAPFALSTVLLLLDRGAKRREKNDEEETK